MLLLRQIKIDVISDSEELLKKKVSKKLNSSFEDTIFFSFDFYRYVY